MSHTRQQPKSETQDHVVGTAIVLTCAAMSARVGMLHFLCDLSTPPTPLHGARHGLIRSASGRIFEFLLFKVQESTCKEQEMIRKSWNAGEIRLRIWRENLSGNCKTKKKWYGQCGPQDRHNNKKTRHEPTFEQTNNRHTKNRPGHKPSNWQKSVGSRCKTLSPGPKDHRKAGKQCNVSVVKLTEIWSLTHFT